MENIIMGQEVSQESQENRDEVVTQEQFEEITVVEPKASWAFIGSDVKDNKNVTEVLKNSGLDFVVEKKPLFADLGTDEKHRKWVSVPTHISTIRMDTKQPLGVVSASYEVCQNQQAFDFINFLAEDIKFERAGMTSNGMVYIIASFPEKTILGDRFAPYGIFSNGFNGGFSVRAAICPLRIVCQNQFAVAFKNASNSVTIRHTSALEGKLQDARLVLAETANYMKVLGEAAEKMALKKISALQFENIMAAVFPIKEDATNRQRNTMEEKRANFMAAFNADDNGNFRDSMWGMVNGFTRMITHAGPGRKTQNWKENRFMATTFGTNVNEFIDTALEVIG